jgi:hypothetical protein
MEQSIHLIDGWELTIPVWHYLMICLIGTFVVRVVLTNFKASSIVKGEYVNIQISNYFEAYYKSFIGFGTTDKDVNDHLLTLIIGFAELAAYPLLIFLNQPLVIGGWIAVKTAGQWGYWDKNRTAFNRYLFGNIMVIAISFLWLAQFFKELRIY